MQDQQPEPAEVPPPANRLRTRAKHTIHIECGNCGHKIVICNATATDELRAGRPVLYVCTKCRTELELFEDDGKPDLALVPGAVNGRAVDAARQKRLGPLARRFQLGGFVGRDGKPIK